MSEGGRKGRERALARKGLVTDEVELKGGATEEGMVYLFENIWMGIKLSLANAKIEYPAGYVPDEVELTDSLVKGMGQPRVSRLGNLLGLRFIGEKPLVGYIVSPLNLDEMRVDKHGNHSRVNRIDKPRLKASGIIDSDENQKQIGIL